MDTINERIKTVRKHFKMTQKEFSQTLGISQTAVSWGEQPGNNVPDSTIKAICMAFHVSETWLRTGTPPMIVEPDTFSLDQYANEKGCSELEREILKAYFDLDRDIREKVLNHFMERLIFAKELASLSAAREPPALTIDDKVESYRRELEAEEKAKALLESDHSFQSFQRW